MTRKIRPKKLPRLTPRQRGVRLGKKLADAYRSDPAAYVKRTRLQREVP